MWEKIKELIPLLIVCLVVLLIINQCYDSGRYREQLDNLIERTGSLEQSVNDARDRVGQQEQLIEELADCQSRIESTIDSLAGAIEQSNNYLEQLVSDESAVDGSVGAIRATTKRITDTITVTLTGIEQEGLQ